MDNGLEVEGLVSRLLWQFEWEMSVNGGSHTHFPTEEVHGDAKGQICEPLRKSNRKYLDTNFILGVRNKEEICGGRE